MDPVVASAIINGIASGVASGLTTQPAVAAYKGLMTLLKKTFGHESDVVQAIHSLETKPESEARKAVIREAVADSGADRDAEIIKAASQLMTLLKNLQAETHFKAKLKGSGSIAQGEGAVAAGKGGVAVDGNISGDIHMPGSRSRGDD